MFRSATFKLTIWYMAIVMAISIVCSYVIYHFATNALNVSLQHQTMRIYRAFPVFNNNPLLRPAQDSAEGSHHILLRLVYFNIVLLTASGFASYLLARRTLRPIEAAHERQKRFTADVSHELRTPLTSLRMTDEVALMDDKASAAELRQVVASNLEDVSKMEQLINSLLRLTRLEAAQTLDTFTATPTEALLHDAIEHVKRSAKARHITIEQTTDGGTITADTDSITQLLVILLDNAIKYSPDKSTIEVSAASKPSRVILTVTDHGNGISAKALPHVFDRFYRADEARTPGETGGYGLGLSIAKLIADTHKGNITLTSEPSHGTKATVELPQQPA